MSGYVTVKSGELSPHAWGWSVPQATSRERNPVIPTRVGMVRSPTPEAVTATSYPHTRGDGPLECDDTPGISVLSPHAWGWSAGLLVPLVVCDVIPTRVGMVRSNKPTTARAMRYPHTRGDGPGAYTRRNSGELLSPHAWGWSGLDGADWMREGVIPTRVGMVRRHHRAERCAIRYPHTRGDGPAATLPAFCVP